MKAQPIHVYLPDTRGVEIQRYGSGNLKIGFGAFTYSRLPGQRDRSVTGVDLDTTEHGQVYGTCPGSTDTCEQMCYAKRVGGVVRTVWRENSNRADVPPIPVDCTRLRIHVGGDFDSVAYIENWIARLTERPDVRAWGYTRSWRVAELLPALERLRALPNLQLFASIDASMPTLPPTGWRRAWMEDDSRIRVEERWPVPPGQETHHVALDGTSSYVCPEETGAKPNCLACNYCILGRKNDVTFLKH